MGLIGDNCVTCRYAAQNDKGLSGGWWRFWAEVFWLLAYSTENGADLPRRGRTTGEQPLGLHWRWHRWEFRAGRWRMVRGTVGVSFEVERGEAMSLSQWRTCNLLYSTVLSERKLVSGGRCRLTHCSLRGEMMTKRAMSGQGPGLPV